MKLTLKNIFGAGLIALAFSVIMSKSAAAQSCAVPPTCDALGYTKTASDCSGMSVLKCPFDQSKIFCVTADEIFDVAATCEAPAIGDILYWNMSCSSSTDVDKSKTPIGVIFDPSRRLAIALQEEQKVWSTENFDIPDLPNLMPESATKVDWSGKNNTQAIIAYCKANGKSYPAAEYASSYVTRGTKAGDWYLPALSELNAIHDNKGVLKTALAKVNGAAFKDNHWYWSSSEAHYGFAWVQYFNDDYNRIESPFTKNDNNYNVRPVLAF